MDRKKIVVHFILIMFITFLLKSCTDLPNTIQIVKNNKKMDIDLVVPKKINKVEIRVLSDRNKAITKYSTQSPKQPEGIGSSPYTGEKDFWFPVVDIELDENIEAVLLMDSITESDEYCMNGHFHPGMKKMKDTLIINSTELEHWENGFYVTSRVPVLKKFYLRKVIDTKKRKHNLTFGFLGADWCGEIEVYDIESGQMLYQSNVEKSESEITEQITPELERKTLLKSLELTIDYILRAQHKNSKSPTYNGLFMLYDIDAATYRRSDWVWSWGPTINLLLKATEIPEIAEKYGKEKLISIAKEIGETSLSFQMKDTSHPAYGLVMCRYDPNPKYEDGYTGFYSPPDSYFLCGYGWIPLYEKTGDKRYLDAAILMMNQTERLIDKDGIIEQDYMLKLNKWKEWTLDEGGFGLKGLAETYLVTKDKKLQDIGVEYIDGMLKHFQRKNGTWNRRWNRNDPERGDYRPREERTGPGPYITPGKNHTRGNAWAMIGLISANRLQPEGKYLQLAKNMADRFVENQHADGFWWYEFDGPIAKGKAVKGTAIWCHLMYELYKDTKDEKYLKSGQNSLLWCMGLHYFGEDKDARGGFGEVLNSSGIVYRRWYNIISTYAMSFYGLAVVDELTIEK